MIIGKFIKAGKTLDSHGNLKEVFECSACGARSTFAEEGQNCYVCIAKAKKENHEEEFIAGVL